MPTVGADDALGREFVEEDLGFLHGEVDFVAAGEAFGEALEVDVVGGHDGLRGRCCEAVLGLHLQGRCLWLRWLLC